MDYKIKITTVLEISYALFVLYIVVKRLRYWWTDVRGYKYYLVVNTYITELDKDENINNYSFKIKAKSKNEAIGIFNQVLKDLEFSTKGNVICSDWEEMNFYSNSK